MHRTLPHSTQAEDPQDPPRGPAHDKDEWASQRKKDVHRRRHSQCHLLCPLQGEGFRYQFTENHVQEGDQAKGDADRNAVRVHQHMRDPLQELEALDEMGNHGLADPAQRKADDGDAELHAVDDFVQVAVQSLQNASADAARSDELLDAGLTDADQRKFGSGKESVGRYQGYDQQNPEQHKCDHLRANFNISKLFSHFSSVTGSYNRCSSGAMFRHEFSIESSLNAANSRALACISGPLKATLKK